MVKNSKSPHPACGHLLPQGEKGISGQSVTEFVVMLGILTALGVFLMTTFIGVSHHDGAIGTMQNNATQAVANDND